MSSGSGDGNDVVFPQYPLYPRTLIECCAACDVQFENVVAAGFIPSASECECLVNVNGTYPGKSNKCPLGVENYDFGMPVEKGRILPGACGR